MALPPPNPAGHRISLEEAAEMTRRYRDGIRKGSMFPKEDVDQLLAQPGCKGLRIYNARNKEGEDTVILTGVDDKGNDMVEGLLLEWSFPCPPFCGGGNSLNS